MVGIKDFAALVDGSSVDELANAEAVQRIRQRSLDQAAAYRERVRQGEINSNLIPGDDTPTAVGLAQTHSEIELRSQLADAINIYENALSDVETADTYVARAHARTIAADAALNSYADVDAKIIAWRMS